MLSQRRFAPRQRQRGLSIVELLVGVAIGLVIVAAATLLMTGQLVENRKLLTETQLQQDLRGAADIITRELRRAGGEVETSALRTLWYAGTPAVQDGIMATRLTVSASQVNFDYGVEFTSGPWGFRLNSGVIQTLIGASGWQDLTDANVIRVTRFEPSLVPVMAAVQLPCPKLCADGTGDCWPRYQVRELQVIIEAEAKSDANVKRAITTRTRLRNDRVQFFDPVLDLMCPL